MIPERYCSFEVSKLLKEKGFNEEVRTYYQFDNETKETELIHDDRLDTPNLWSGDYVSAPTHQTAMDWLREIHKLHIEIYANASGYKFIISRPGGDGTYLVTDAKGPNDGNAWDDYKDVVEAALKVCLNFV